MLTIDLHGLNREEARRKIEETLRNGAAYQEKVIRIIHGQGKHSEVFPVLKSWVRRWLTEGKMPGLNAYRVYLGEDGSPFTPPNPGEIILVLLECESPNGTYHWEADAEEREARDNAKGMRADRLRKLRRKSYK